MRAGIIAAGLGERLKSAGVPKPLVPVAGRPLIHWTVEALAAAGADAVTVLLNSKGAGVRRFLEGAFPSLRWSFLEWDSPSSWESFRRVCRELARHEDRFVVSTVDALARPEDVARFARACLSQTADAALAVTPFVEDERPLWADMGDDGLVRAVGADARLKRWVTCGLYGMTRGEASSLEARRHERLRDYWTAAVREGKRVAGVVLDKTIDVDRPRDLASAERFLRGRETMVSRDASEEGSLAGRREAPCR